MKTEEKVLTHAIEKAASLALVVDTDRSELLANMLKEAQVDPKYAKTATAAFNKRASVLEMSGKADENRADDFALADPEKVLTLMDSSTIVKEASLEDTEQFLIKSCPAPMKKVASAPREHINYENKVHKDTYVAHLMGMLDKLANALERESAAVYNMEAGLDRDARALSGEFVKEANAFEFQCASRYFGESLKDAIGKYMPEGTVFEKKAQAIPLETGLFKKASEVVQMKRSLDRAASDTGMLGVGIKKFAADVGTLGNFMEKTALNPLLYFNPSVTAAAADAIQGAAGAAANVLGVGTNTIADNLDAYKSMQSGDGKAKALLDPKLVSFDRNLDRMVAFSDISADDQFKMYPAERLFRAVNSAMDYQPALEAPAARARLKAVVGQLLAQNDRASLADITAMDAAMRYSRGYSDNPANKLPEIAAAAESKAPGFSAIEPQKIRFRTDWTDQIPETRLSRLRELDNDLMAISEKEDPAAIREALDAQNAQMAADRAKVEEADRVNAENEAENKEKLDTYNTNAQMAEQMRRFNEEYGENIVEMVDKPYSELTDEERKGIALEGKRVPKRLALRPGMEERGFVLDFDTEGNVVYLGPAEGRSIPTAAERKQIDAQNEAQRKAEEEDAKRVAAEEKRRNMQARLENIRGLSGTPEERRGVVARMSAQDIKDQYKSLLDEIRGIEGISDADRQALGQEVVQVIGNRMIEEEARVKALSDSDMESRAERLAERLVGNAPRNNRRQSPADKKKPIGQGSAPQPRNTYDNGTSNKGDAPKWYDVDDKTPIDRSDAVSWYDRVTRWGSEINKDKSLALAQKENALLAEHNLGMIDKIEREVDPKLAAAIRKSFEELRQRYKDAEKNRNE